MLCLLVLVWPLVPSYCCITSRSEGSCCFVGRHPRRGKLHAATFGSVANTFLPSAVQLFVYSCSVPPTVHKNAAEIKLRASWFNRQFSIPVSRAVPRLDVTFSVIGQAFQTAQRAQCEHSWHYMAHGENCFLCSARPVLNMEQMTALRSEHSLAPNLCAPAGRRASALPSLQRARVGADGAFPSEA